MVEDKETCAKSGTGAEAALGPLVEKGQSWRPSVDVDLLKSFSLHVVLDTLRDVDIRAL